MFWEDYPRGYLGFHDPLQFAYRKGQIKSNQSLFIEHLCTTTGVYQSDVHTDNKQQKQKKKDKWQVTLILYYMQYYTNKFLKVI